MRFLQDVWCFFILCVCVHRLFFVVYSVRLAHYCYAIGSAHIFIYDLVLQHLVFINDARTMCKIVSLCFCLSITTTSCTALSSCWLRRLAIIITLLLVFSMRMIASGSVLRIVTTLCKRPLYRIMCSPYLLQKLHLPYLRYLLITHLPHNVSIITESCVIKMCLSTNCCCLLSLFSQACSLPMFMFIGRRAWAVFT